VAGDGDDDGDGGDVTIDDDDEADEFLTNVSLAIRARRRQRRLDQRSLAARAGVSKSALARIERGDVGACLATLRKVLAEVGLGIVLVDEDGYPWRDGDALPADIEGGLDRAGRRLPAHLPAEETDGLKPWDVSATRGSLVPAPARWRYNRWADDVAALVAEIRERADGDGRD